MTVKQCFFKTFFYFKYFFQIWQMMFLLAATFLSLGCGRRLDYYNYVDIISPIYPMETNLNFPINSDPTSDASKLLRHKRAVTLLPNQRYESQIESDILSRLDLSSSVPKIRLP
jgi:hypothetical protein